MKFADSDAFGERGFWPTISFFFFAGISGFFLAADSFADVFESGDFFVDSFAAFSAIFGDFTATLSCALVWTFGAVGFFGAVFGESFFSGFLGAIFLAAAFTGAAGFFAFAVGFGLVFAAPVARDFAAGLAAGLPRLAAVLSFLGFADFAMVFSAVFVAIHHSRFARSRTGLTLY